MRSGKLINNLTGELQYQSFMPAALPPQPAIELDNELIDLLTKANVQLTKLDSLARHIPNIKLFISMYVRKEALLSAQIEGTQATLEDVLDPLAKQNVHGDVTDVINYIKATEYALDRLNQLPLCNRLIREIHEILMANVRGQNKTPGQFRRSQNWIGGQGSTLNSARYIPPNPTDMITAMSDLEKYINGTDSLDILIKAALVHYQFETIHPFLDGNGRVGRLLITLFLIEKKLMSKPVLYISYYLKKNRLEYYDRLMAVRQNGTYEQWVKFFLRAIYQSAKDAIMTVELLTALYDKNCSLIDGLGRAAKNTGLVFNYLQANPIIEIGQTAVELELSFNTVAKAVQRLIDLAILVQVNASSRNRIFAYQDYLEILRKDTE